MQFEYSITSSISDNTTGEHENFDLVLYALEYNNIRIIVSSSMHVFCPHTYTCSNTLSNSTINGQTMHVHLFWRLCGLSRVCGSIESNSGHSTMHTISIPVIVHAMVKITPQDACCSYFRSVRA